jgi:hypothetical protein
LTIEVSIRNTGKADTAVVVGAVLGNGAKYMIGEMTLSARRDGAPELQFRHVPRHYPSAIGGRVDDWIVPLPVGASYGLMVQASDFISHGASRRMGSLPSAARLSVRLAVRAPSSPNSDMVGAPIVACLDGGRCARVERGPDSRRVPLSKG